MFVNVISALNLIVLISVVRSQKQIGDVCILTRTGEQGECVLIQDCLEATINLVKNKVIPQLCGFQGSIPTVCCSKNNTISTIAPSSDSTAEMSVNRTRITGQISQQKCHEYSKYVFTREMLPILVNPGATKSVDRCEFKTIPLIVGGDVAKKNEFPHMALIGYETQPGNIEWMCGGSLISEQHILVAAHCLFSRGLGEAKYARLGLTDLRDYSNLQQFKIIERIAHPDYNPPAFYNNIAILKLDKPAQLSPYLRPACLFPEHNIGIDKAVATSWGSSGFDTDDDYRLLKNTMKFLDVEKCSKSFVHQDRRLPYGIKDDDQLCAKFLNRVTKDTCQGNSGGPLQIYHNSNDAYCMYDILGVASFGKACNVGNAPEVYTRVSRHLKWIEDTVWR